jgi:FixJ family two-component response regulator
MPIVFISGHAETPMSVLATKARAVEFLAKPVRHKDRLSGINAAVAAGLAADEAE